MAKIEGLSNKELKELIVQSLKETGVDPDLFEVKIKKGARVVLRGEVDSERERDLIMRTIRDVAGIDDIVDGLIILKGLHNDLPGDDSDYEHEDELFDDDHECIGTEDVFRSVEDGLPYIPPTDARFERSFEEKREKRPRRKDQNDR